MLPISVPYPKKYLPTRLPGYCSGEKLIHVTRLEVRRLIFFDNTPLPHHPTISCLAADSRSATCSNSPSRWKTILKPVRERSNGEEALLNSQLAQYDTSDPTSFAYVSARERWPIILTQAIDDVFRSTAEEKDEEKSTEGRQVVSELARLKYELQHNRELQPLPEDGEADVEGYNKELKTLTKPNWHSVPWLYAECYLYRYLHDRIRGFGMC